MPKSYPSIESLKLSKDRKAVFLAGAASFNAKPKQGIAFLEEKGIIAPEPNDEGTPSRETNKGYCSIFETVFEVRQETVGGVHLQTGSTGSFERVHAVIRLQRREWFAILETGRKAHSGRKPLRTLCESCSRRSDYLEKLNLSRGSPKSLQSISSPSNLVSSRVQESAPSLRLEPQLVWPIRMPFTCSRIRSSCSIQINTILRTG